MQISSLEELRAWLQVNWKRPQGVWLVRFKKNVPAKFVDRLDVIDELLCYGWVDGIARKLDDERTMQLIFPRKQQAWAESYKKRVEILERSGRMAESGRAAVEQSKASGKWNDYALVDALAVPNDLQQALRSVPDCPPLFRTVGPVIPA